MNNHVLTPDTQTTLLLCGRLGATSDADSTPLSVREYNSVARGLAEAGMRPGDLLERGEPDRLFNEGLIDVDSRRIRALLDRGTALALAVETWSNKGLWVISRSDAAYPDSLRSRLGGKSPPILHGAGNKELLSSGGLVVVGSRDVDAPGLEFARNVSRVCADQHIQIISGGARGVDATAMLAALEQGGTALGVLADRLQRLALSRDYRAHLGNGSLVLVSPYDPDSGFHVGKAMGRNKVIYALGTWSLVVDSAAGKGGTWAGATENLKHGWAPTFVRDGAEPPIGNAQLIEQGAIPIDPAILNESIDLRAWFTENAMREQPLLSQTSNQLSLFGKATDE